MGDQRRLHQVIFNLVSNAVKYSTEGGSITDPGETRET